MKLNSIGIINSNFWALDRSVDPLIKRPKYFLKLKPAAEGLIPFPNHLCLGAKPQTVL
jgi:hypothetical protein